MTFAVAGGTGSFGGAQGTVKVTFGSNFDVFTIVLQYALELSGRPVRFPRDRRMRRLLIGTAGAWFVFDYAHYGNTLSLPAIL